MFSNCSQVAVPSRAGTLPIPIPCYGNLDYTPSETFFTRRNTRAHTAPCMSLPNLRGSSRASAMSHQTNITVEQDEEKLKWVPALNTWVVDKVGE